MIFHYDLHIHSCLSPCGDMDNTPNNIVNMALLKGLDIIAVSDHNTALNLPAVQSVARRSGILLLPAIEAETREEVHVLCYMPSVDAALALSKKLYNTLLHTPNMPSFFGEQVIMDENDEKVGIQERLFVQSTSYSLDGLAKLVRALGGVPVPAHINRASNALLHNLGFIPPEPAFTALEVSLCHAAPRADLKGYRILYSSDAHTLSCISECSGDNAMELPERSTDAVLRWLGGSL